MYRQGEILIIPVPFTDLTSLKKRPVNVVLICEGVATGLTLYNE